MPASLRTFIRSTRVLAFGGPAPKLEMFIAALAMISGLWLLAPIETFSTSRGWDAAAKVAPEQVWGVAFCVAGLVAFIALVMNRKYLVMAALVGMVWLWSFLALMFYLSNPRGVAAVWAASIMLASLWSLFTRAHSGSGKWIE